MKFTILLIISICSLNFVSSEEQESLSFIDQLNSSPVLPTMIQYVLVPAVESHGSYYLGNKSKELMNSFSRWQSLIQSWASQLSSLFHQITKIKFDSCTRKLLCSLGKAKFQTLKEVKRSTGSKAVDFLNSFFRLPSVEQKLNFTYLEAREFGAAGGDCEAFPLSTNCPIATSNFDQVFYILKQLF